MGLSLPDGSSSGAGVSWSRCRAAGTPALCSSGFQCGRSRLHEEASTPSYTRSSRGCQDWSTSDTVSWQPPQNSQPPCPGPPVLTVSSQSVNVSVFRELSSILSYTWLLFSRLKCSSCHPHLIFPAVTPLFQLIFLERLECTRHCAACFIDIVSLSPHSNLIKKVLLFHHVADEEMKAQRGKMTCPQSQG